MQYKDLSEVLSLRQRQRVPDARVAASMNGRSSIHLEVRQQGLPYGRGVILDDIKQLFTCTYSGQPSLPLLYDWGVNITIFDCVTTNNVYTLASLAAVFKEVNLR